MKTWKKFVWQLFLSMILGLGAMILVLAIIGNFLTQHNLSLSQWFFGILKVFLAFKLHSMFYGIWVVAAVLIYDLFFWNPFEA
jgi:hypothetical protein